jgi:membrane fusion protein (multidrug efflux system)
MRFLNRTLLCSLGLLVLYACDNKPAQTKAKQQKTHYVEVIPVQKKPLAIEHTRTGTLRARREVEIHNQEEGKVDLLPFYEGDRVKKGQLIAQLDDSLLQAQLNRARITREKAEQDLKRIEALNQKNLASDEALYDVESQLKVAHADETLLKTRIGYTRLTAPFNGVITERNIEPGSVAERFTHLLTVADPSSLVTEVNVSALLLARLKVNEPVDVTIDALGGKSFPGHILRIHPTIDPVTRRGTVEVEIKPVPAGAQPGQFCRVLIRSATEKRTMIPFKSLRRDDSDEYVYVVDDQNKAQRVPIVSGLRIADDVEVLSGLEPGQQVITKGFLNLQAGKSVQIVSADE